MAHVVFVASLLATAGCAGTRLDEGRFRSSKGYSVVVPQGGWTVVNEDRADLVLRHGQPPARILVNASCGREQPSGSPPVLARHLLIGLRHRTVVGRGEGAIAGRPSTHMVVEGEDDESGTIVRVDAYVMKSDRCVYDFLYAAPPASFGAAHDDFQRLVDSFGME